MFRGQLSTYVHFGIKVTDFQHYRGDYLCYQQTHMIKIHVKRVFTHMR